MAEEQVILRFGETGAEVLGSKIKATTKSIRDMEEAMKRAFSTNSSGGLGRSIGDIGKGADLANNKVSALARGLTYLGAAITGIAIRKFVGEIVTMVDALTNLQNRIRTVTEGTAQLTYIQHELFQMSRDARTPIETLATVYSRTARSVEGLGKSQQQTLQFTETLSKAVRIGGSTSVESMNAMVQLSQGLASGTLRGDELRAVMEQLPEVSRLIAEHMQISRGELKKLGAEGKLSAETVFEAVLASTDKINAQFAKLKPTVAEAMDVFKSKAIEASSAFQPFISGVAEGILKLSDNFDLVVRGGTALVQVVGVMLAAKAIPTAIRAIQGLNAALATNPWGLAALGVSALIAALLPFADKIGDSTDSVITLRDAWETLKTKIVFGAAAIKYAIEGMFGVGILDTFSLSLEDVLRKLAKVADFMAAFQPGTQLAVVTGKMSAYDAIHANQRGMEKFLANARGEAADRKAREFQSKFADTNERFNAFMEDRMPGAHTKTSKTSTAKGPGGTTFEDLLREQRDALGVLQAGQLQIRPDGGNITLPSQQRGPMFLASEEDQAVAKQLEATVDRLGKKQPRMTPEQIGQLEDLIRQQQGLVASKKEQEEIEKEITKRLDEQLKLEVQLIENQRKLTLQDDLARGMHDVDVANSLDPNFDTKKRIQELEDFRDTPGRIREQAVAAQLEITKLKESMNPLAVAFQSVADTMVQGFSDAIARSIVLRENIGSLLNTLGKMIAMQAISGLISTGINAGVGALAGAVQPSTGAGAQPLLGGRVPGFAVGGYTGSTGGVTHPNEYVLNPQTTSRLGVGALNAINNGGGIAPTVNVYNNTGASVSVDQSALSRGEVNIMIDTAIAEKAPRAVAGAMSDSNSPVSKSLRQHYDVNARNV